MSLSFQESIGFHGEPFRAQGPIALQTPPDSGNWLCPHPPRKADYREVSVLVLTAAIPAPLAAGPCLAKQTLCESVRIGGPFPLGFQGQD